jgi:hypothetical protein
MPAARKRMCRHLTRRQMSWKELRVRVTIVNDPKKLAELQQRKLGLLNDRPAELRLAWARVSIKTLQDHAALGGGGDLVTNNV